MFIFFALVGIKMSGGVTTRRMEESVRIVEYISSVIMATFAGQRLFVRTSARTALLSKGIFPPTWRASGRM